MLFVGFYFFLSVSISYTRTLGLTLNNWTNGQKYILEMFGAGIFKQGTTDLKRATKGCWSGEVNEKKLN